ncbi:MAG: hypothetical protein AB1665_01415 [Candidatus Thermoplasmatota archaeon]
MEELVRWLKLDTEEGRRRIFWLFLIISTGMLFLGYAIILYLLLR